MTKITPEFKRAFRHYVDGAGRMGLLTDVDVINMQSRLTPYKANSVSALPYYEDDYWSGAEYSPLDVVIGFRKAFDYVYVRDIELLRAHGQAVTVDAVRGLLDRYAAIMDSELDAAYAHGALMMPPALREELARSDAERKAIREKRADYWHRASAELLKLFRNFDEEEGYTDLALHRLGDWTENACAYWATQQTLHGRQPVEGEARKLCKAYGNVLFEDCGKWEARNGLDCEFTPYESLSDAMAAFCAAYSHGIDPYTGKRPRLPRTDGECRDTRHFLTGVGNAPVVPLR